MSRRRRKLSAALRRQLRQEVAPLDVDEWMLPWRRQLQRAEGSEEEAGTPAHVSTTYLSEVEIALAGGQASDRPRSLELAWPRLLQRLRSALTFRRPPAHPPSEPEPAAGAGEKEAAAARRPARTQPARKSRSRAQDNGHEQPGQAEPILSIADRRAAILVAALEDLASARSGFSFQLTYRPLEAGSRQTEAVVEGIGLAQLSRYLAQWFKYSGELEVPLQVVDEGSGKLRILVRGEKEA